MKVLIALPALALLVGLAGFSTGRPAAPAAAAVSRADSIPFPADYRRWTHVKSEGIGPQNPAFATSGGIHHIYANKEALEGYLSGKFPDGAVIVADFVETRDSSGLLLEGARRRLDVMMKDSQRFPQTGGWGFEQFKAGNAAERRVTPASAARCFTCHVQQKDADYVFSKLRT